MVSGGGGEVEPVEPGVGVPGVVAAGGGQEAEEGENGGGGDHTVSWTVGWCQSLTGGCGYRIGHLLHHSTLTLSDIVQSPSESRNNLLLSQTLANIYTQSALAGLKQVKISAIIILLY